jgi:hypothetical protein
MTRENVLDKYKNYIILRLCNDSIMLNNLIKMRGKTLGCWCKPEKCHGDILVEILDKLHDYEPYPDFSDEICNKCNKKCNSYSGWKCNICNKCWCNEHNTNELTCNCLFNILNKISV